MALAHSIAHMHQVAGARFHANPGKCFQRHIRELYDAHEKRESLHSLDGAIVEQVSYEDAEKIILKYEWLQTMPRITRACYGLKIDHELIGVAVFGMSTSNEAHVICGQEYVPKTICLARGACVPHAPRNAASFLIRRACKQACMDFGWEIFFAYSDADAGEIGTVYQATNWKYIGNGNGRNTGSFHVDWLPPDGGKPKTSNALNHDKEKKFFRCLGWNESKGNPREYIRYLGWVPIRRHAKGRYVWFEGTPAQRAALTKRCRYSVLPYPKRERQDRPERMLSASAGAMGL